MGRLNIHKGLVTNYGEGGGGYKMGGGDVKFYPYEKGGAEKVLAMLKGGGAQQVLGYFLCGSLKF